MNVVSVILSITVAMYLEPKWITVGLAGVFTIHYFIGAAISFYLIKRHQINLPVFSIMVFYLKLLLIFSLSLAPTWAFRDKIPGGNLIYLLLVVLVSAVLYLFILRSFKMPEVTSLMKMIKARKE